MDKKKNQLLFTEAERIDFNRRTDIASAIAPVANATIQSNKQLSDSIKVKSKKHVSIWYLIAGVIGYCIHYFISGEKFVFDYGIFIVLLVALHWVTGEIDLRNLKSQQLQIHHQLTELQISWCGAVGDSDDFWKLGEFEIFGKIDHLSGKDVMVWWEAQTASILVRVCGVERGLKMAREWEELRDAWRLRKESMKTTGENNE